MTRLQAIIGFTLALAACGGGGGPSQDDSFDEAALQAFEDTTLGLTAMLAYGNALKHVHDALLPALAQVRVGESRRVRCAVGHSAQVSVDDADNSETLSGGDTVTLVLDDCDGSGGIFPYQADARGFPGGYFGVVRGTWTGEVAATGRGLNGSDYEIVLTTSDAVILIDELPAGATSSGDAERSVLQVNGTLRVITDFDPSDRDPFTVAPGAFLFVENGQSLTIQEGEIVLTSPELRMLNRFDGAQSLTQTTLEGRLNDFGVGAVEIETTGSGASDPQFSNNDRAEITTPRNFEGSVGPHFAALFGNSPTANLFVALDTGEQGTIELPWAELSNQWFSSNLYGFSIHSAAPLNEPVTTLQGGERLRVLFTRPPDISGLPMQMTGVDPNDETAPAHTVNLAVLPRQTLVEWEAMGALNPGYRYTLDLAAVTSLGGETLDDDRVYGTDVVINVSE